jgi:hypothetical protein
MFAIGLPTSPGVLSAVPLVRFALILSVLAVPAAPAQSIPPTQRPELFVQAGAISGLTNGASAFSPDGTWYITGNGSEWQLWSTRRGELRRWQPVPANLVSTLAVASDAKTILSIGTPEMGRPQFHDGLATTGDLTTTLSADIYFSHSRLIPRIHTRPKLNNLEIASPVNETDQGSPSP